MNWGHFSHRESFVDVVGLFYINLEISQKKKLEKAILTESFLTNFLFPFLKMIILWNLPILQYVHGLSYVVLFFTVLYIQGKYSWLYEEHSQPTWKHLRDKRCLTYNAFENLQHLELNQRLFSKQHSKFHTIVLGQEKCKSGIGEQQRSPMLQPHTYGTSLRKEFIPTTWAIGLLSHKLQPVLKFWAG